MTESEFRALLTIEGKSLKVEKLNKASLYYIAVIECLESPRFAVGKSPAQAVKKLIKEYYADN